MCTFIEQPGAEIIVEVTQTVCIQRHWLTSGERPLPTSGGHGFGPHGSIGHHSRWPGLARPVVHKNDEGRESPTLHIANHSIT